MVTNDIHMKRILYTLLTAIGLTAPVCAQTLTLEECKSLALTNNRELQSRQLEQQISRQTRREAFTRYFPDVKALGGYMNANKELVPLGFPNPLTGGLLDLSMIKNGKTAALTAVQPVFAGGQIVNSNRLAGVGEELSRLQYRQKEESVEKNTELYFWQVVQLEEKLRTVEAMEKLLAQVRKDVEMAIKAGIATQNDLLRVELQEYELAANRLKVENGIRVSKLLLGQYIGRTGGEIDLSYPDFRTPDSPLKYHIDAREAVFGRPETAMLDCNVKATRLQKKIEVGKRLPTVGIGASYFYHDFMEKDYNAALVYASVTVPLTDWWGGGHAIKRQSLKQQQAENDRLNSIELMVIETEQTWNELQEAYQQIQLARQAVGSATENMRMNSEYFRAGTATLADVLDAQSLLQQNNDRLTTACTTYQTKLTAYRIMTGQAARQ